MRPQAWALVALVALALLMPAVGASPLGARTFVLAGESQEGGSGDFLLPRHVADVAGELVLLNLDTRAHNVMSTAFGPDTNAWCGGFPTGFCPLFVSAFASTGEQVVVRGTDQLTPLQNYGFRCSSHPAMTGLLAAV